MPVKALARRALNRIGFDIVRKAPAAPASLPPERSFIDLLDILVDRLIDPAADLRFIQVGAHDGQSHDPLHRILGRVRASGVFVEPQPRAFRALRDAYPGATGFAFENVAISGSDGSIEFFMLRDDVPDLPVWLHQSASLDRSVVATALTYFRDSRGIAAIPADHDSLIASVHVPTMTWDTLLGKHGIAELDLLVLDTMGFDCKLLADFPFGRLKPRIIHFEHSGVTMAELDTCLKHLQGHGYSFAKVAIDTIACLDVPNRPWSMTGW